MGRLGLLLPILFLSTNTLASFRFVPIPSRLVAAPSSQLLVNVSAEPSFSLPLELATSNELQQEQELHWEKVETRRQEKELFEGLLREVFRGKESKPGWAEELLQDVVEQAEEEEKEVKVVSEEVLRDAMGWEWLSPPSNESEEEPGPMLRAAERRAGREMYGAKPVAEHKVVGFDVDGDVLVKDSTETTDDSTKHASSLDYALDHPANPPANVAPPNPLADPLTPKDAIFTALDSSTPPELFAFQT